jgi:hypothetical protein
MSKPIRTTRIVAKPMFYETVVCGPADAPLDPAFDSKLEAPSGPAQDWILRITLRVFYNQINPRQITDAMMGHFGGLNLALATALVRDAAGTPSLIKPWSQQDWANFIRSGRRQAAHWNNQFWLVPPTEVPWFDITDAAGTRVRPNVKCEFELQVALAASLAHRTIKVVNLATQQFFRSWQDFYDSDDVTPVNYADKDQTGAVINTQQLALTHEIGHALGLGHVNVLRHHRECGMAITYDNFNRTPGVIPVPVPAQYQGGSNNKLCYGPGSTADAINNIMGQGMRFSAEDAQPWLDRLPEHLALSGVDMGMFRFYLNKWRVVMAHVAPRVVH